MNLHSAGSPAFRGVNGRTHTKLGDRIQRDIETRLGLLRLLLHAVVVDAVERIVGVVDGMAVEADVPLRTVAVIHSARREHHEAGPITAAYRDLLDLLRLD